MNNKNEQKNKALVAGTIIYAIGNFGTKFLSFLIVPLYTYYIAPADMGDYDLLCTTINLLTPLITMQISDAAYRWMISNDENIVPCISATYKLIIVNCSITAAVILGINLFIPIQYCYHFLAILILGRILGSMQKLLRGLKNQKLFAFSGIVYTAVFLFFNVLLICGLKQGVEALLWSMIIANIAGIVLILLCDKRMTQVDFKTNHSALRKEMLHYSMPLVPSTLNWWVMGASNRYVIRFFIDNAANGIFAVANKFPSILSTIFLMFNNSWTDMSLADNDSKEDIIEYYSKVFKQLYIMSFTATLVMVPATKIVTTIILSESYKEASIYIAFLYLGAVFQAFSSFYGVGYLREKSTIGAASTSIYGAVANVVVNVVFIKFIGLHAASVATFLGFYVMWVIRRKHMKDSLPIRIDWRIFNSLLLACVLICIVSIWSSMQVDLLLTGITGIVCLTANKTMFLKIANKLIKKFR